MADQTELKKELHKLADMANALCAEYKRVYDAYHQPGTVSQDLSELDYAHCDTHSFIEDGLVPLIALQDRYDDQNDDDDSDYRYEMRRDDAHEARVA